MAGEGGGSSPGVAEILLVFVERPGTILPFAEVFHQRLEIPGFHKAGNGLGFFSGRNDDGGGEFQLPMGKIEGEFVAAVLLAKIIAPALPIDGGPALGVDLDGIELVVEILGDGFIGIGFFIHLFAPAAPRGIKIDEDGLFLLLQPIDGLFDRQPGNTAGIDRCGAGRLGKGLPGAGQHHQEGGGKADGE